MEHLALLVGIIPIHNPALTMFALGYRREIHSWYSSQLCSKYAIALQQQPCATFMLISVHIQIRSIQGFVYFSNQSLPLNSGLVCNTVFGDGTSSTAWNPVHQYTGRALHGVPYCWYWQLHQHNLRHCNNCNPSCSSLAVCNNQISLCGGLQQFSVVFTPAYINNDWYTWTFGDGTGSHDKVVTHQYQQAGELYSLPLLFTVTLTVHQQAANLSVIPAKLQQCYCFL